LKFNKELYNECIKRYKKQWSIEELTSVDKTIDNDKKKGLHGTDKIDKQRVGLTSKLAMTYGKMTIFKALKTCSKNNSLRSMVFLRLKSLAVKHYGKDQEMNGAMETQKGCFIDSMIKIVEEVMVEE